MTREQMIDETVRYVVGQRINREHESWETALSFYEWVNDSYPHDLWLMPFHRYFNQLCRETAR